MNGSSRAPLTIGLAITALHVIHIVEYCTAHEIELDILLVPESRESPRSLTWIRRTASVLGVPEPMVGRFVLRPGESSVEEDLAFVDGLVAGDGDRPIRIVSGGFHLPILWFMVERYVDRLDRLVLVDEGVGTFASPIGNRNIRPDLLRHVHTPELDAAFTRFGEVPATFYSRYPLEEQLRPIDSLERVDKHVLARLLQVGGSGASDDIFFVGSPLHLLLAEPERDVELTSIAIHLTRRSHPGAKVVYIPHRDEREEKLELLAGLVEVRALDHPIELEGLITGAAPKHLVTFNSTAVISYGVVDHDVDVEVFLLPESMLREEYLEPHRAGHVLFKRLLGEQLITHGLDLDSWSAVSDLPIADVALVLGSDGESNLQSAEAALAEAEASIAFAGGLDGADRVIYVPQREESRAKRERLTELVEVETRVLPLPLLLAEWGFRPRHVVTVRTRELAPLLFPRDDAITAWILQPPPSGYYLEERAVRAAREEYRDLPADLLRWEVLPAETASESVNDAQRHHTRDASALRERIGGLEARLAELTAVAGERYTLIGELSREMRAQERVISGLHGEVQRLQERLDHLREVRDRLRLKLDKARKQLAVLRQQRTEQPRGTAGLRGLLRRGHHDS